MSDYTITNLVYLAYYFRARISPIWCTSVSPLRIVPVKNKFSNISLEHAGSFKKCPVLTPEQMRSRFTALETWLPPTSIAAHTLLGRCSNGTAEAKSVHCYTTEETNAAPVEEFDLAVADDGPANHANAGFSVR